jgi:hypothetical protein
METSRKAARLTASVCLLALTACSGGGGGGTPATTTPPVTTPPVTTTPPAPTVSISAPATVGVASLSSNFNFTTNLPAPNTAFALGRLNERVTPTSVTAAGVTDATAIFRGTVISNGVTYPVFDLNIPSLSVSASNVRGDGTPVTLSGGGQVSAAVATLNYTLLGAWTYTPVGGGGYLGMAVTGSGTPGTGTPTTGSATYSGTGGVVGAYFVPTGSGTIQAGTLSGNVSLNVNFSANTFSGTMSNMTATAYANGSGTTPWNNVSLTGTVVRGAGPAVLSGSTSTSAAPTGAGIAGFSSAATGSLSGAFYGPAAQEVGANWTLYEPTSDGGKAALGMFGAK